MDEHLSSCIAVYITVIDLIHSLRAEIFLKTSNVLFCYCRRRRPEWDCYVLIMHESLWCITNISTLGCYGHLRIRLPGDCFGPSWPPQLHRARTATGIDWKKAKFAKQMSSLYKAAANNIAITWRHVYDGLWYRLIRLHYDGLIQGPHQPMPEIHAKIAWKSSKTRTSLYCCCWSRFTERCYKLIRNFVLHRCIVLIVTMWWYGSVWAIQSTI